MRAMVFDAGPIITLTTNNLLPVLKELHKEFDGDFFIPQSVKHELIDKPLQTKKFKFEALQVLPYIADGTLKVYHDSDIEKEKKKLMRLANRIYLAKNTYIKIVHDGELEAIAMLRAMGAKTFVIDERVTRMLIEEPEKLEQRLEKKLHTNVTINHENLDKLKSMVRGIKIIRSIELVTIAYEKGFLDKYMARSNEMFIKDIKKTLIEALLWGMKLNGCAVSEDEINEIIKGQKNYHRKN